MNMVSKFLLAASATVALFASSAAIAQTYVASRPVGATGSVNLAITTDGTLGALGFANIVDYNIQITDSHGTLNLIPSTSDFGYTGFGFSATATDLFFNFSGGGYALFQSPTVGSGQNFFCFASSSCGLRGNAENLLVGSTLSEISSTPRQGNLIVASIRGAVPEPGTWAMMLVGFGAIGMAMRQTRKAKFSYSTT